MIYGFLQNLIHFVTESIKSLLLYLILYRTITFAGGNATPVDSLAIRSIKDLEILLENSNSQGQINVLITLLLLAFNILVS